MEQTLNIMSRTDLSSVNVLVSTGVVRQNDAGTYLVIETNKEELI